jgi:hypothetical protein
MFTFPHRLCDFEQLIDAFDPNLVDIKSLAPEFHILHENIKVANFALT